MPSSIDVSVFSVATEGLSDPRVRNFSRSAAVFGVNATLLTGAGWQGYDGLARVRGRRRRCCRRGWRSCSTHRICSLRRRRRKFYRRTPRRRRRRRAVVLGLETGCPPGRHAGARRRRRGGAAAPGIAGLRNINGGFVAGEAASVARMYGGVKHACCAVKRGVNRTSASRHRAVCARAPARCRLRPRTATGGAHHQRRRARRRRPDARPHRMGRPLRGGAAPDAGAGRRPRDADGRATATGRRRASSTRPAPTRSTARRSASGKDRGAVGRDRPGDGARRRPVRRRARGVEPDIMSRGPARSRLC